MANARPENSTSFDEDSPVEEHDEDIDDVFSNGKQNGGPPTRSVDRYGFIGGDHYTSPDEIPRLTLEMIRKREVKWIDMFENWEKWMTKRFKKVKARCRKGIPPSLRARAWQHLCGSSFLMNQNAGKFDEYLSKAGDPKWIEDIKKDLHRQFPLHEIFALRGGHGQEDLFRILKAYTVHNPQEGYCQAQGPIAAVLLMHMPAEQAFWCLVSICEKYLPGYYSLGLEAVHIDGDVLFGLLKKSSPLIYKHLKKQRIEPILYMTEWFMCIFSRTLPWTAVLRVWDMFFCEGVKVMFRIALILFKLTLGTPGKLSECPSLYETMDKLKHIPHQMIDGDFVARESLKLNIDEKDMEKEHQRQITKRRNLREKALKEASATKGKKEKKKLLGKLTKKDSESKLLQQQHQQTPANVMLISSQKLPETTQTAQPKMALPISASSPTVGQTTAVTTTTTNTTTTTGIPQRWSADLDAHSNINSHVLCASQISMEDESQRSVEQLPAEKFAHDEEQQVQETLAPVHSKSVLVPVEEIRQKLAGPEMMAPRAIEVIHATTAAVSEAVPARVLPIHLNEQAEVVTVSEAATSLHIEGVVEPTHADARHASDVAAPEVRMAMPQPQSPAEVNSIEVRPEESHSQTTCHTSPSDPTHSEPARSGAVTRAGGTQSDVAQPKPKSKSKSRKSKAVKIELVHSDGGGAKGVLSLGGGSDGDSHGARPTLTSFGQRSGSSGATSSSTSSSKSTVTRRTKTRTTEEERTSTTIVRRSMESGETTVMSTTMTSSMSSSSWKGKPESGDAPPEARPHSATFNNSFDGQWNIVEGTPVDSLHSTTVTANITTTTSTKNTAVTAADGTTAVGDPTASALINSPTDTTPNNTTTTTTAINNNMTTTTEDKQATSPKSPNELSMNCDATSPTNLAAHDGLSEEDMLSLRESRL